MKEFIIESNSSIDNADELIRCKDCKYHEIFIFKDGRTHTYCDYLSGYWGTYDVEENDFCSRAERKEFKE